MLVLSSVYEYEVSWVQVLPESLVLPESETVVVWVVLPESVAVPLGLPLPMVLVSPAP